MKSKPRAKTDAGLAVISEEAPRKFMDKDGSPSTTMLLAVR